MPKTLFFKLSAWVAGFAIALSTLCAGEPPAGLAHLPKSHRCVLISDDPLPWAKKILSSATLEKAFSEEGALGAMMAESGSAPDFEEYSEMLDAFEQFVPNEMIFSAPPEEFGKLARYLKLSNMLGYAYVAWDRYAVTDEGSKQEKQTLADFREIQAEILKEFKAITVPELGVWLRFRGEAEAEENFDSIAELILPLAETFDVESGDGEVSLHGDVSALYPEDAITMMLDNMAMILDPEDEMLEKFLAHYRSLEFHLTLRRIGDGVLVRLGPSAPAADEALGLGEVELGALWKAHGLRTMFGSWDIRPVKRELATLMEFAKRWDGTPIAEASRLEYGTDSLDDARLLLSGGLDRVADLGSFSLDGLKGEMRSSGGQDGKSLTDLGLATMVPATAETYVLSSTDTLAQLWSDMVAEFEGRLALKEMTDVAGNFAALSASFYQEMDRFRQLSHFEDRGVFQPGSAIFMSAEGQLDRLMFAADRKDKLELEGPLPSFRFAMVGLASDPEAALKWVGEVYDSLFDSARVTGKKKAQKKWKAAGAERMIEADLGLGVPTHKFTSNWAKAIRPMVMEVEGDLKPHCFRLGDAMVMSTSVELSKQLIAAQGDASKRKKGVGEGGAVSEYVFNGKTLVGIFDAFGEWFSAGMLSGGAPLAEEEVAEMKAAFDGIKDVLAIFEGYESTTKLEGGERVTRFEFDFAE